MSKRVPLTAEQRGELVLRLLRREATASDLAREASISEPTLYQWRDAFLRAGFAGLNGRSDRDAERRRHARELAQRDQVIGEMTVALKVLKKLGGLRVTQELRDRVRQEMEDWNGGLRLTRLLTHLGVWMSTWYRRPKEGSEPRGRPRDSLTPADA